MKSYSPITLLKLLYFGTFVIISIFLMKWATEVGMDTDAVLRIEGGKTSLAYLTSLGRDTTYKSSEVLVTQEKSPPHNVYYGTGIESTACLIADTLDYESYSSINTIRKFILVLLSCCGIFVLSYFVKLKLDSWLWGGITLIIIFFSPTFIGYSFWQTKDASVAAGFSISLICLYNLFTSYPITKRRYLAGLFLGVFLITIVRVQGILIIFYLGVMGLFHMALFWNKYKSLKEFIKFYSNVFLFIFLGLTCGLMIYPYFWEKGYFLLYEAITVLSKHPTNPLVLFEGSLIKSIDLPWYYLPKMMLITFPIFILVMFLLSFLHTIRNIKNRKYQFFSFFFLFTFLFPISYLLIKHSHLYSGWRQELFVYSSFIPFCVIGFAHFLRTQKKYVKIFISSVVIVLGFKVAISCFNYAPYQYLYYNEFVGGINGAFGKYNLDWAQVSVEPALKSLINNEKEELGGKTILCNTVLINAMTLPEGEFEIKHSGFIGRNYQNWNYAVFIPLFVPPNILELAYPPKGTIEEIEIEGVPICCVVKRENFDDLLGIQAYQKKQYKKAYQYFINAYKYNNSNYIIYPYLAILSYQEKQYENAEIFAKKQLNLYPHDENSKRIIATINKMKQNREL
ncbi:hypothetical protein [uncultured Draconibacterium sp.]|uniref:hypothetical protein n=1 Tax=uncultured Draconibacterium sp. TaxID=1573823 RepID=UPI003218037D